MNLLIVYSRDLDIDDSGGSRTTIELANYLAEKPDCNVYCTFSIINGNVGKVIECPILESDKIAHYRNIIVEHKIDYVIVPEGYIMTKPVYKAAMGTKCRIISALHNRPGYERNRVYVNLLESLFYNKSKLKRCRALFLLALYPFMYLLYTRKVMRDFKLAYEMSDRFVLLSDRFFDLFVKKYNIKDGGIKLAAIPNGLSFGNVFLNKDEYKEKENICLIVGRLNEQQKRISMAIKIWREIEPLFPDWNLKIVGFGRSEPYYRNLVKKYNLKRVFFEGKQSPLPYYKKAKIFFMTSAFEGFGMTLTEAQQMGCVPVVIDSYEALHDIVEDGYNGCIANNMIEFIENVKHLIHNPEQLERMADNGIHSCKKFQRDNIYERYYLMLKEF